jgi:hypothetical protein
MATMFREATLETAPSGTDTDRTVSLSCASELPVLRRDKTGPFYEVISMGSGDANLGFLNSQGLLLQDHNERLPIGYLEKNTFRVRPDRKLAGVAHVTDPGWISRISKTDIAVSLGYTWIGAPLRVESHPTNGLPVRYYAFKPLEVSFLTTTPADSTVGINRSANKNMKTLDTLLELALSGSRRTDDDFSDVSLVQTIAELNMEPTGRVAEMHRALEKTGETGRGVPFSLFGSPRQTRDSQASIFSAGAAFVQDDMQVGTPLLFNTSVCRKLGAMFVTGLKGNFQKPQATTAPRVAAVGEIAAATATDILTRSDDVKPRRLAAQVVISNEWLKLTGATTEAYIRKTISDAVNTELDRLALFGAGGSEEPLGIMQTIGVQSAVLGGVTWTKLVNMKKALASANIPISRAGWATSPLAQAFLESTPQIAGFPRYLIEQGEILNAPALASNQLADSNQLVYSSAWDSFLVLIWGDGLWFVSDPYSQAPAGKTVLTACMLFNVLPLYPQAFIVSADAANQ